MKSPASCSSIRLLVAACLASTALVAGCNTTKHDTQSSIDTPKAGHASHDGAAMQLPPGWTEADMQACMMAGTPGKMHEHLAMSAGTWTGTNTMWMAPDSPPMTSQATCTTTVEMDGRYTHSEFKGEIPGMGSFHGVGFNGFDNVSQKFVSTWIDNHSTGIMMGEGALSADGKTMTWNFKYNCPIAKGPASMRQIERWTGDDTMTMEMFGKDPKSGKEYQMMKLDLKRTARAKAGA